MNAKTSSGTVALVWRGAATPAGEAPPNDRLTPIIEALAREGLVGVRAPYSEEAADAVRAALLGVDAALVWVDPISEGRDRSALDPLLRAVAARGVWVSSHPDVILKMGVKEVLYRTRDLGWGVDTDLYPTMAEFRARFPARLAAGPRVVKQNRGNGGQGVWKVEPPGADGSVRVLHAQRGSAYETLSQTAFMDRCDVYFAGDGRLIDQPYQPRLPEGMIRCYMVQDRVVGFGRQLIKALMPPPGPDEPPEAALPGPRIMSGADYPPFQALRRLMEGEWIPAMIARLEIDPADLPVIWDADFLYGPRTAAGDDTYVLCEINISAVLPIPDEAPAAIAHCVARGLAVRSA